MSKIFLSYSNKDHVFAELALVRLGQQGFDVWTDSGQLRAGEDWRHGIDQGISESFAILVALSTNSANSPYVTYEWASGIGKGKTVVPILLEHCSIHPKLEPIQYLDFSMPGQLPWSKLVERLREVEQDDEAPSLMPPSNLSAKKSTKTNSATVQKILGYLNQRGYQMVSFDRIRRRIDDNLSDEILKSMVVSNPSVFRFARLRGNKPGLAKL